MAKSNSFNSYKLPMLLAKKYYAKIGKLIKSMESKMMEAYNKEIASVVEKIYKEIQNEEAIVVNVSRTAKGLKKEIERIINGGMENIDAVIASIEKEINIMFNFKVLKKMASEFVSSIVKQQKKSFAEGISKEIGVSKKKLLTLNPLKDDKILMDYTKKAIGENVDLIKTIPKQFFGKIREEVLDGLQKGVSTKNIAKKIQEIGGVSERRGKFIAIDQLGKIHGDVNMKRQTSLGIEEFIWITSRDERVRETHTEFEGKVFRWDKGAGSEGLIPGQDFRCRCTSKPVLDGFMDKVEIK